MMACWKRRVSSRGTRERRRGELAGLLDPPLALVELDPKQQAATPAALACPAQHIDAPLTTDASHFAGPDPVRTLAVAHPAWPFDPLRPLPVPSHAGGSGPPFV